MQRRAIVLGAVAAAVLAACAREQEQAPAAEDAAPPDADPTEAVRAIYDPYFGRGVQRGELREQAPWSAELWSRLEAMIARSNEINEPILDFDPFADAQDGELANLNLSTIFIVHGSNAGVRAQFTNSGEPREVIYDLVWENDGWRVDNIRTSQWDLRQIAAAPNAAAIAQ